MSARVAPIFRPMIPSNIRRLNGYADDVVELGRELGLHGAVFVGHSVSAMIGVLASIKAPGMFSSLVLVGPSARYIDDGDYKAALAKRKSANCWSFWKPTTWDGRRKWLPPSWETWIVQSLARN